MKTTTMTKTEKRKANIFRDSFEQVNTTTWAVADKLNELLDEQTVTDDFLEKCKGFYTKFSIS